MAAIFPGQLAQKGRPPQGREAGSLVQRRQTAEPRVDEDDSAARLDRNVVDIQIAGRVARSGNIDPVIAVVVLTRRECVLEPQELIQRAQPQCLAIAPQSHAAVECPLEHRHPTFGTQAKQDQLPRPIRGEAETQPLLSQPAGKLTRGEHLQPQLIRRSSSGRRRIRFRPNRLC